MGTLTFYDAAWPPHPPPETDGVCYYLPGGDATHGWTPMDLEEQPARYRLGIFVRSDPREASAVSDARAALWQLQNFRQPPGTLVAWDCETSADPAYMRVIYEVLNGAGYKLIDYGSESSVFGNDNPDGYYWSADWTDVPHLSPDAEMTQWVAFSGYDADLASSALPFWDTRPAPAPSPKPKPAPPVLEDDMPLMLDTSTGPYPLAIPYGTGQIRFLCTATEADPLRMTLTWLDEGAHPVPEDLDWGAADKVITVQPKHDEARLDVIEGGGPWVSVQFDPRKP